MSTVFTCPECESDIPFPEGKTEGFLTCEFCNSEFMYGKYMGEDAPNPELVNEYYKFIAPELIALQRKILLFNDEHPDSGLFNTQTIEEAKKTIENALDLLEKEEEENE